MYHIYVMCVKVLQDILFKYNKISFKDSKDIKKYSCKRWYIIFENDLYFFKWNHIIFIAFMQFIIFYFLQQKKRIYLCRKIISLEVWKIRNIINDILLFIFSLSWNIFFSLQINSFDIYEKKYL